MIFKIDFTFYVYLHQKCSSKIGEIKISNASNHTETNISESKEDSRAFKLCYDLTKKGQNKVYVYQVCLVYA